ncbi:MAG: DUF535 family protein [Burkholderiaceae bacterium]
MLTATGVVMSSLGTLVASVGPAAAGALPAELGPDLLDFPYAAESALALLFMIWQSARLLHPEKGWRSVLRQLRYAVIAWWTRPDWRVLREEPAHTQFGQVLRARGGRMHLVAWAYLHRRWSVAQRVEVVRQHYALVERTPWLQVPLKGRHVVARLDEPCPGLSLQLDRPEWIENEGELALSLFKGPKRLYTVALVFGACRGRPAMMIGSIQGVSWEGANATYAELTKQLHGCRPRDLIVHASLCIAESLGLPRAYAISDACRHHRAARFPGGAGHAPTADYDEVWGDRGGVRGNDGFFELDTAFRPRDLNEVPSKKRAMYRRRYDMLGALRADIQHLARANRRPVDLVTEPAQ